MKLFDKPLYVIIFAVFPTLSLLGINIGQATLEDGIRPLIFSILLAGFVFAIGYLVFKSIHLSAVATVILMLVFFTYGHLFQALEGVRFLGVKLARNSFLIIFYIALACFLIRLSIKNRSSLPKASSYLNAISIGMLIFPLFQLDRFFVASKEAQQMTLAEINQPLTISISQTEAKPDIYLIVLDGYNRADILKIYFDYDDSGFINQLKALGFTVADCSMSNYNMTNLSLGSELNLNYIDAFFPIEEMSSYEVKANWIFKNSLVRRSLEESGYKTYTYKSNVYPWMNWENVDRQLSPMEQNNFIKEITAFEKLFIDSTIFKIVTLHYPGILDTVHVDPTYQFDSRSISNFIFDTLPQIASEPAPKFVYAHLIVTHTPFYFTSEGDLLEQKYRETPLEKNVFIEGYGYQVDYLNKRIIEDLKAILANSESEPIIILQADHGFLNPITGKLNRPNQILNAYYLPGIENKPYSKISPVNTFRFIFNNYFDADYPYLEDTSYHVDVENFSFQEVRDEQPGCQ
jgi:hypothetical protein